MKRHPFSYRKDWTMYKKIWGDDPDHLKKKSWKRKIQKELENEENRTG